MNFITWEHQSDSLQLLVVFQDVRRVPVHENSSLIHDDDALRQVGDIFHAVGDENDADIFAPREGL